MRGDMSEALRALNDEPHPGYGAGLWGPSFDAATERQAARNNSVNENQFLLYEKNLAEFEGRGLISSGFDTRCLR